MTLDDIALQLGVSRSTVSRALHDHPRISKATRRTVKALAAELGYIPNDMARGLRTNQTRMLGFVTQGTSDSYPGDILRGVQNVAFKRGYCILAGSSDANPVKEQELIRSFLSKKVDGLIIAPVASSHNISFFGQLLEHNIPMVFVDRHLPEVDVGYVTTDNYDGAYRAVLHLVDQGYRRILCMAGLEGNCFETQERIRGYQDVLHQHHLAYELVHVKDDPGCAQGPIYFSYSIMQKVLQNDDRPDAVFAINDAMAIGAVRACLEVGLSIPEDMGIIGFDNLEISEYLPISLSSVRQPMYQIGTEAVSWLLDNLEGKKQTDVLQKVMKPSLIIRESTG